MMKRENEENAEASPEKKVKTESFDKKIKPPSFEKKSRVAKNKATKKNPFPLTEKPEDWNEFKKKRKEVRLVRKQSRSGYDVIAKAKLLGERLRLKKLEGGSAERTELINELHILLKENGFYTKAVLSHDTSRIVQWLLKYSSAIIREEIAQQLLPAAFHLFNSKYGIFCLKRLIKYGNRKTKFRIVSKMYGNAVKLSMQNWSAAFFEYAYSTWASAQQQIHLQQEFFGEMYKNSKDDSVKKLQDVFKNSPDLKVATLGATKANLLKAINKNLMDSTLIQTVLYQFMQECTELDRAEMISLLIPFIVIIGNSKYGSRAAMECIWQGTNKDRKLAMKTIKEHVVAMALHENGHRVIITLLDTADDTVLLHKILLGDILQNAQALAVNEWGRKVLLWLVMPADSAVFHPVFVKELTEGRIMSNCKKDQDVRRKEILGYSIEALVGLIRDQPKFWLKNSSLGVEMVGILKAGRGEYMKAALESVVKVITDPSWTITFNNKEFAGIEDAGLHMVLRKLAKHDKILDSKTDPSFGDALVNALTDQILQAWIPLNRGCFLLLTVCENCYSATLTKLREKVRKQLKVLKEQNSPGGKILLEKIYK